MANQDEIKKAEKYVSGLEALATSSFQKEYKRSPSPSELQQLSHTFAAEEGKDYFRLKKLVDSQPGPVSRAASAVGDAIGSVVKPVARGAAKALFDRTESLRSQDSSLPSVSFSLPQYGPDPDANSVPDALGSGRHLPYASMPPREVRFGAEELADVIELGVPMATEAAALGTQAARALPLPARIGGMILGNMASEVGAEYLRYANAKASGMPTAVPESGDPTDTALHFIKTATGGALLGVGDIAFNVSQLQAQRQVYKRVLGLGTPDSVANIKRMERLGLEPNLAEGMAGIFKPMAVAMAVYPMTAKRNIDRARTVVRGLYTKTGDSFERLGDRLVAGVPLADRSRAWFRANDKALQYNRKQASAIYTHLEQGLSEAEAKYGRAQVHVEHESLKPEIEKILRRSISELPLVRVAGRSFGGTNPNMPMTPSQWRLPKSALAKNPDYGLLEDLLNMEGTPSVTHYMNYRNLLEDAAERASGNNDPVGRVFSVVAGLMRHRIENMAAPAAVKAEFNAAQRLWMDYNTLFNSSAWKSFRRADPEFGLASKITDRKPGTTAEVVLQNALKDGNLSPDVVETWYQVAKEGGAVSQFKGAMQSHFDALLSDATRIPEKGSLAGIETVNFKQLMDSMGLDDTKSIKWAAHRRMIRRAGGNPDEVRKFLETAAQAFPDGIPNPSATAARRTSLSGLGSALRLVTGASVVGAAAGMGSGQGATGAIGAAVLSFIALRGLGQVMFDPRVMRKLRMTMDGGISLQGKWRTLWNVASSVGMTRALQSALQEQGIDPLVTPLKAERYRQTEELLDPVKLPPIQEPGMYPVETR